MEETLDRAIELLEEAKDLLNNVHAYDSDTYNSICEFLDSL